MVFHHMIFLYMTGRLQCEASLMNQVRKCEKVNQTENQMPEITFSLSSQ